MTISKKTRFEVFKRDSFTCRYCGNQPPAVTLEPDHVVPVSAGGADLIANLVTSCFDCNRGKGARQLTEIAKPIAENAAELLERQEQLTDYRKLLKRELRHLNAAVKRVEVVFSDRFTGYCFNDRFRSEIRNTFLPRLPVEVLVDSMQIACNRDLPMDRTIKYFCGINWQKIRGYR